MLWYLCGRVELADVLSEKGGSYLWPRYLMQFGGERVRLWFGCLLRRWR